ncbi:DUF1490 family protein [Motilibacter aurantiacus]|uniref:DUF1490 family protein n=1 Tax=Motilibacter aurantiacus TaxID=2714955 RepID=UPI00140DF180|nr:DUF1490 family protein [Motilibacter aurantiacus]
MALPFGAGVVRKGVGAVVTGVVGVAVVRLAERRGAPAARRVAVEVTKAGIRGGRALGEGVERTRLAAGDVAAQAREEMGEQAPVPGTSATGHDGHQH